MFLRKLIKEKLDNASTPTSTRDIDEVTFSSSIFAPQPLLPKSSNEETQTPTMKK